MSSWSETFEEILGLFFLTGDVEREHIKGSVCVDAPTRAYVRNQSIYHERSGSIAYREYMNPLRTKAGSHPGPLNLSGPRLA